MILVTAFALSFRCICTREDGQNGPKDGPKNDEEGWHDDEKW